METPSHTKLFAWLQLLRLPNIFTAVADVTMGYLVTQLGLEPISYFALLVASSCLLYLSGMVLNDVVDADLDAQERPDRPIPSGRISRGSARALGVGLWLGGIAAAWVCSHIANDWRPGTVAAALAIVILLYDGALKRSRIASLLMGECRFLNVLLGMSLFVWRWEKRELFLAAGIGFYVMGITIFARTDARVSSRGRLVSGFAVILAAISLLVFTPVLTSMRPPIEVGLKPWYVLWGAITLIISRRCLMAIAEPSPVRVQAAVRHSVQSIIVLNAAICVGYSQWFQLFGFYAPWYAFGILALLMPTYLLTWWLNAT